MGSSSLRQDLHAYTQRAKNTHSPRSLPVPVGRHPGHCLLVTAPLAHNRTNAHQHNTSETAQQDGRTRHNTAPHSTAQEPQPNPSTAPDRTHSNLLQHRIKQHSTPGTAQDQKKRRNKQAATQPAAGQGKHSTAQNHTGHRYTAKDGAKEPTPEKGSQHTPTHNRKTKHQQHNTTRQGTKKPTSTHSSTRQTHQNTPQATPTTRQKKANIIRGGGGQGASPTNHNMAKHDTVENKLARGNKRPADTTQKRGAEEWL